MEGRVVLFGRRIGNSYTDPKTCPGHVISWMCHVRSPSSCTIEDAERAGADRTAMAHDGGWFVMTF
jgi:hypothetical protein